MEQSNITLIFEKSKDLVKNNFSPSMDIETDPLEDYLPENLRRKEFRLSNVPEFEIVRHYVDLSTKNYGLDTGIYPLGSCTMKYNSKINEVTARLPGFSKVHPLQEENEGSLELLQELGQSLCEITGMDAFTLDPPGGAAGEFTGILIIKKYLESKGFIRDKIIVPDSAHGTNPASAAMCGFSIIELKSNENGEINLAELEFAMKGGDVAGLMLTNPNTLGLFDRQIKEITEIVHKYDGLCYYDGANFNPMLGICRPGDMGFDVVHLNLHKTFSTPHGGGGPGAGPVGVKEFLAPYLPCPHVIASEGGVACEDEPEFSIGRVHGFWGNFGVLVRALTYIKALGADGLKKAGEISVLNANYLRASLRGKFTIPHDRTCMHEFILKAELPNHITAEDVAKRMLDYGVYAPTIYFPLIVHEAMMIEPTETESKESLDHFIEVYMKIFEEAEKNPELLKDAPHTTLVGRLDATAAARKPILRD